MDYVREELLRQKRALEALMAGDASEEERVDAAEETPGMAVSTDSDTARIRSSRAAESGEKDLRPRWGRTAGSGTDRKVGYPAEESMAVPEVFVSTGISAAGSQSDARQVSRAIQRDARRYDGGFTIY